MTDYQITQHPSHAEFKAACILLEQMYPDQPAENVHTQIPMMLEEGWKMVNVMDGDICAATILYKIGMRMFCGKYMQLDSLFIDKRYRRQGVGKQLFAWLEDHAKSKGCKRVILESLVENFTGHQFFYRHGYFTRGYVINKVFEGKI